MTLLWILRALLFGLPTLSVTSWAGGLEEAQKCFQESKQGNFDLATQSCTRALESGQLSGADRAITFSNRGNAYLVKKDYTRAIQDYDQAIRVQPKYAEAFNNRGYAYYRNKEYSRAIQDFDQAIRLKPDYVKALNNRAGAYNEQRQYEYALVDYEAEAIPLLQSVSKDCPADFVESHAAGTELKRLRLK